ncbi:MAG: hypothetical protein ABI862_02635 [Ilumatobacteraceae bacterium]
MSTVVSPAALYATRSTGAHLGIVVVVAASGLRSHTPTHIPGLGLPGSIAAS